MKVQRLLSVVLVVVLMCVSTSCKETSSAPNNSGTKESDSSSNSTNDDLKPDSSGTSAETTTTSANSEDNGNLTGESKEILEKLVADTKTAVEANGEFYYMSITTDITADTSIGFIGFSADNFNKYVIAASSSKAGIGSQAHEIILIQCKDSNAAKEVKKLVERASDETDGGYNSMKWVCVAPEKTVVVESGNYVLIAASKNYITDAIVATFKDMAGKVGEADTIFEHEGEEGEQGGGGAGFIAG